MRPSANLAFEVIHQKNNKTPPQETLKMKITTDKTKLSIGDTRMQNFLQGGLTLGRFSYWTGRIHEFRIGTMFNLIISAACSNRPPEGVTYQACYISAEVDLTTDVQFIAELITDYPGSVTRLTGEADMDYIRRAFSAWGWELMVVRTVKLTREELTNVISKQFNDELRLICLNTFELFEPGPGGFMGYLDELTAVVPKCCHMAVSRPIGQHAGWLRRQIDDDIKYLRILSRTGYVPKFGDLSPEYSIVHGMVRSFNNKPCAPFVSYHHCNEHFDLGFVNMKLKGSSWIHDSYPDQATE